jgi:integrase
LGTVEEFPTKAEIEPERVAWMQKVNAAQRSSCPVITLVDFVEHYYLPWVKTERRASTYKGYAEIWRNHLAARVGSIRLRDFRTVDASRTLRAVAEDCEAGRPRGKNTLNNIKSMLSSVFTHARNEGEYDGANPVQGARIPRNVAEPGETHAYGLAQIQRILDVLPLLPRAVLAVASLAGLREGELRRLDWRDWRHEALEVRRSVWKSTVNAPKTLASAQAVPVIPFLAKILSQYRASMHDPAAGTMFHNGDGRCMDMDKLAQRVIRPAVKAIGLPWYGWHGFRRGIASNLYQLGANDKIVQRILRHAKPHVTRERYIKAFDPQVLEAMGRLQAALDFQRPATGQQQN